MKTNITFGPPYAVLNLSKVGLRYFRLCINASSLSKDKLIANFINHPNIGWIFSAKGWLNLAIGIWARDNAEINDIGSSIRNILDKKDEIVYQSELTTLYGFGNRPITHKSFAMPIVDSVLHPIELAPIELDYIKLLTIDSSIPKVELSKILGVSLEKIKKLHKKLKDAGIIVGYQKRINYKGTYFKVFVDSKSQKTENQLYESMQRLWKDNACIYIERANGKYDFEFELILQNRSDLKQYLDNFTDYKVAELTENLYTNLYPLSKTANLREIKDTISAQHGSIIDFRNSKLWYLNHKGTEAYLSVYENRKYFETMEKSELELFGSIAKYLKRIFPKITFSIIDIGSGDGLKGKVFIEKLGENLVKAYYPIDMQPIELFAALKTHEKSIYARHPTLLDIEKLQARFPLKMLPHELCVYAFLGGTYGNFPITRINSYLKPLLAEKSSILLVTMPIVSKGKTDKEIIESYANLNYENIAFGPLAQLGFEKKDFVKNPNYKNLIVQINMEMRSLVSSFILANSVTVFNRTYKKGTVFKMISSWKPTLEEFKQALEKDFIIDKIYKNKDMAIAIISKLK